MSTDKYSPLLALAKARRFDVNHENSFTQLHDISMGKSSLLLAPAVSEEMCVYLCSVTQFVKKIDKHFGGSYYKSHEQIACRVECHGILYWVL